MDRREKSKSKVEDPQRLKTSFRGLWTQDCPHDPHGTGAPPASGPVNRVADPAPQGSRPELSQAAVLMVKGY